jgi:hypothetical protein
VTKVVGVFVVRFRAPLHLSSYSINILIEPTIVALAKPLIAPESIQCHQLNLKDQAFVTAPALVKIAKLATVPKMLLLHVLSHLIGIVIGPVGTISSQDQN